MGSPEGDLARYLKDQDNDDAYEAAVERRLEDFYDSHHFVITGPSRVKGEKYPWSWQCVNSKGKVIDEDADETLDICAKRLEQYAVSWAESAVEDDRDAAQEPSGNEDY